ncbi:transcription antitermination factor NusB [Alteromonas oceanisediminis]|uniref:transcription antitermination factor NusB n=1 Tax=Alteromonas oceanisediminis TaxID=2836180 RepID=UPI001BD94DB7|nr:transcription antitermination factor NusB [Alteromonas oceanisediminis]MBT0585819.1 transcription antitermination factor NusB [Alteromonas oceanisediminis]
MKVAPRRKSRELALQGVYSWQLSNNDVEQIELMLATTNDMKSVDMSFFQMLLRGAVTRSEELDAQIKPYLGRLPEELDPIEKAILRIATFELVQCMETPYKVIINEAIEVAKSYGAQDSHKFINGVLDKAVKTLRKHERK